MSASLEIVDEFPTHLPIPGTEDLEEVGGTVFRLRNHRTEGMQLRLGCKRPFRGCIHRTTTKKNICGGGHDICGKSPLGKQIIRQYPLEFKDSLARLAPSS